MYVNVNLYFFLLRLKMKHVKFIEFLIGKKRREVRQVFQFPWRFSAGVSFVDELIDVLFYYNHISLHVVPLCWLSGLLFLGITLFDVDTNFSSLS